MPTGYTAAVVDGTITEFPAFAMQCARAFGALITMRDDPSDAPIPDEFKPSTYSEERLAEARQRLEQLRAMTPEQATEAAATSYRLAVAERAKWKAEYTAENVRLQAMLNKVEAWNPPTADHVEMKKFMIEQLTISMHGPMFGDEPKELTGQDWLRAEIKNAMRNVEYHAAEQAKEIERARTRTEWVKSLRASLAA